MAPRSLANTKPAPQPRGCTRSTRPLRSFDSRRPARAGIAKELLPRRLYQGAVGAQYRYFPHKLPLALDGRRATFLFVQAEDETESAVCT